MSERPRTMIYRVKSGRGSDTNPSRFGIRILGTVKAVEVDVPRQPAPRDEIGQAI